VSLYCGGSLCSYIASVVCVSILCQCASEHVCKGRFVPVHCVGAMPDLLYDREEGGRDAKEEGGRDRPLTPLNALDALCSDRASDMYSCRGDPEIPALADPPGLGDPHWGPFSAFPGLEAPPGLGVSQGVGDPPSLGLGVPCLGGDPEVEQAPPEVFRV
jgi:hypothetical protein